VKGDESTAEFGDLCVSQLHEQLLCSLDVSDDVAEVGVERPESFSVTSGLAMLLRKSI